MKTHSYVKLWNEFENNSRKLEESGKILEKTCGLGPTQKIHRWMITWKGDCTGWIKWLEWDSILKRTWTDWEWKCESSEVSCALRNQWMARSGWLKGTPAWESIWKEERSIINTESFNWIQRKRIREWRMINLKLPEHLPENHQVRTLMEKNGETSHP